MIKYRLWRFNFGHLVKVKANIPLIFKCFRAHFNTAFLWMLSFNWIKWRRKKEIILKFLFVTERTYPYNFTKLRICLATFDSGNQK